MPGVCPLICSQAELSLTLRGALKARPLFLPLFCSRDGSSYHLDEGKEAAFAGGRPAAAVGALARFLLQLA